MLQISTKKKKKFKADLAPLIDVVFLLLIFFMLTFATPGQGMDVQLPKGTSESNSTESILSLNILKSGEITLDEKEVAMDKLLETLKGRLQSRANKTLAIQSDPDASYDIFAKAMDIARQAGVSDFSIIM